jgi:hypothetical protein
MENAVFPMGEVIIASLLILVHACGDDRLLEKKNGAWQDAMRR